jgi:hypothetical protein
MYDEVKDGEKVDALEIETNQNATLEDDRRVHLYMYTCTHAQRIQGVVWMKNNARNILLYTQKKFHPD